MPPNQWLACSPPPPHESDSNSCVGPPPFACTANLLPAGSPFNQFSPWDERQSRHDQIRPGSARAPDRNRLVRRAATGGTQGARRLMAKVGLAAGGPPAAAESQEAP